MPVVEFGYNNDTVESYVLLYHPDLNAKEMKQELLDECNIIVKKLVNNGHHTFFPHCIFEIAIDHMLEKGYSLVEGEEVLFFDDDYEFDGDVDNWIDKVVLG